MIDREIFSSAFLNADCMEVMKNYPDNFFDLAIVDPVWKPTGGGYTTGKYSGTKMSQNSMAYERDYHVSLWQQKKTGKAYFDELFRVSKNQIIWGANYFSEEIGRNSQGWIVWNKNNGTTKFADCELAYTSFNIATRMFTYTWNGMIQEDMQNKEERIHPTQKPVALYRWILERYAKPGDIILDTHVGSASSLIACHQTGHRYLGTEIDEVYYEQAKKRLEAEEAQTTIYDFIK